MEEFDDSDSEDLEAMFPESPGPDLDMSVFSDDSCPMSRSEPIGPVISRQLKPLYLSFFKKELFLMSATISDKNERIVSDPESMLKPMEKESITPSDMATMLDQYMYTLQRILPFKEFKKPRYVFVNNTIRPVLISLIPATADFDKKTWFEGTMMSLKASLKCALPLVHATSHDELEKIIKTQIQQFRSSRQDS